MGPAFVYIAQTMRGASGSYSVFLSVAVSLISFINPLTTIYFVRPYREAVKGWLRWTGGTPSFASIHPVSTTAERKAAVEQEKAEFSSLDH